MYNDVTCKIVSFLDTLRWPGQTWGDLFGIEDVSRFDFSYSDAYTTIYRDVRYGDIDGIIDMLREYEECEELMRECERIKKLRSWDDF